MRGPLLDGPLGEHTWRNHDAIMMRLMSHRWHSASDENEAGGRRAWRASEACTMRGRVGRFSAAPSVSNHEVIMMQS